MIKIKEYIFAFMQDHALGFDSGYILEVKDNYLFHNCNTYSGCSGGAIINKITNNIIGIHIGSTENLKNNIGVYMNSIINNIKSKNKMKNITIFQLF